MGGAPRPDRRRRAPSKSGGVLVRRLAGDDRRIAYWVRHVRIGVLLSEIAAFAVLGYALLTSTPAGGNAVVLVFTSSVVVGSPVLLLLPLRRILTSENGALLFYAWSVADTVVIAVISRVDGGSSSPLATLLFLTLAFMAAAYPPGGVIAMGVLMAGTYLLAICGGSVDLSALFVAVVMLAFTVCLALSSGNAWDSYEQQLLLLRTQETLAATDPLTGCLNRRSLLSRLRALADQSETGRTALVIVDLDGFKALNDTHGHAAGDDLLVRISRTLTTAVREQDTVARLGGDEFAVLATISSPDEAAFVAERLRRAVADVGASVRVHGSVGVTTLVAGEDPMLSLQRADAAMYRAKGAGGDRVAALV